MKKVLLVTNIPSPYRVDLFYYLQTHIKQYEFYVIYCAREADNRCWNVDTAKLLNTTFAKTKVISIKRKYDTKHIYIPKGIGKDLLEINPDIVIAWEYNPIAVKCLFWCKWHRKKYISLTDGTLYSERNINFIQRITRKIIIGKCNASIASSTKAKEKLLKWGLSTNKIFVSLLTVDVNKIRTIGHVPEQGRLLYVGSMIERKGLDLLVSALRYVDEDFQLRIVGNGTDKEIEELKTRIKNANLLGKVEFCGFKQGKDLLEEYQYASVFVLPTREDCFGLVLLEAACTGTPNVTSKYADGAYDIITENVNGSIIDPYNAEEFGKTIESILRNPEKYRADKKIFDKFSFESVSKGYVDAIEYTLKDN